MVTDSEFEIGAIENRPRPKLQFHLVQALAKADRDELAMQTCVELGLASVTPWAADRSIVRWDGKEIRNQERWQQIAIEAMKQSQQAWLCQVHPLVSTKAISGHGTTLVLDPTASAKLADHLETEGEITLIVGPEGGISDAEFTAFEHKGFQRVRLGHSVLRTSSAGPAAIAAMQFASGSWN
jgi:16S rRNA (uracil1498-N3)-methyltransferase